MRNSSKWTRLGSGLLVGLLLACSATQAQCLIEPEGPPDPEPLMGGGAFETRHGWRMTTHDMVRVLVILMEVEYTGGTDPMPGGSDEWQPGQLPTWVDNADPTKNLFDHDEPTGDAQGRVTRYFQQASSGAFNVLGDYLLAPTNNGVFRLQSTTGNFNFSVPTIFSTVSTQLANTLSGNTYYGHDDIDDFDRWVIGTSTTGVGQPKEQAFTENPRKYDHVAIFCRNCTGPGNRVGRGGWNAGPLLGMGINTYTLNGAQSGIPTDVFRHEFGHMLFGHNNFHTSGGGWGENMGKYWVQQSGGWSLMGLNGSSINSWNAWDRRQMGWMAPGQSFPIAARNADNTVEANGDLDPLLPGDAGIYVLRDFVLTGDALRIKLPYTHPSDEYPEWIWVENHQGRASNGCLYDAWIYENASNPCDTPFEPGLFMYLQIAGEALSSNISSNHLYEHTLGHHADKLRPLSASGNHDMAWVAAPPDQCDYPGSPPAFVRQYPNPLTGFGDTHLTPMDHQVPFGELRQGDHRVNFTECDTDGSNCEYGGFQLGHPRQAFRPGGNTKLGIGTNPSSASAMNLVCENDVWNQPRPNLRRIYLNGFSIELLEQMLDGSIKVQVRFDDVDVTNDARWCADEIVLSPVPTSTGHSLNLKSGNTLLLDQGLSASRITDPVDFNGSAIFADPTVMRCTDQTWFNLEPNSEVVVDNGSTLRLESGSRLDVAAGAVLRVKRGGTLELEGGSVLNVAPGGKVLIEEDLDGGNDGRLVYQPNARINLEGIPGGAYAELEIAGLLEIADQATFTVVRAADAMATHGTVRFSSSVNPSQNIIAGANSRFVLRGDNTFRQLLVVEQESLYGPPQLAEFTLHKGTAKLADHARIVPPVTNSCAISFIDARVTSTTGTRNLHRGVRLNGQHLLTLSNSIFEKGSYGIYSYNSTLHTRPSLAGCSFRDCGIGMYNYDTGIQAQDCSFTDCGIGLECVQMSQSSSLGECTAYDNGKLGVSFRGPAMVDVRDPVFKRNGIGLFLEGGATGRVFCGSISNNVKAGIQVSKNATLRMDGSPGTPHQPVTLLDNEVTILCSAANNCFLNLGYNSMRPLQTGVQKTLSGTFVCQPYAINQPAERNNWNGLAGIALTSAEYSITACGVPLNFVDHASSTEQPCGRGRPGDPPGPGPEPFPQPNALLDPLFYCPTCEDVETDEYGTLPLNLASLLARLTADNDSLPDNERDAITGLNQVLMNEVQAPSADEQYLLNYNYDRLKESFSDGLGKGQLSATDSTNATDDQLALVEQVQQKRIADAPGTDYADFRMYTLLERAQAQRATGKLEAALLLLSEVDTAASIEVLELLAQIACFTQVEKDLRDGILNWDGVELAMALCDGAAPKMMLIPGTGSPAHAMELRPSLRPNPATTSVLVEEFSGAACTFRIIEPAGRTVLKEVRFTGAAEVQLQGISPGIYLCRLTDAQGHTWMDKLVVSQ